MTGTWSWDRGTHWCLIGLAVAYPLAQAVVPALIALSLGCAITHWLITRPGLRGLPKWTSPMPWMAVLYFVHGMGLLWTTNLDFAALDLGIKASMILMPLLFVLLPETSAVPTATIARTFVWANIAAVIFCMVRALVLFLQDSAAMHASTAPLGLPYTNRFFTSEFSAFLHPSYAAQAMVFAICSWVLGGSHRKASATMGVAVIALLMLGVALCASKMGWITLALALPFLVMVEWNDMRLRRKLIAMAVVGAGLFATLVATSHTVRHRIGEAVTAARAQDTGNTESSTLRMVVWRSALSIIAREPILGTGTGDVKDELVATYRERGHLRAAEDNLNAHSQFLQTGAALGIPALGVLLASLLVPLLAAIRRRDHLLIAFLVLSALNWSVESMLEVQAGVVFFLLFAVVLTLSNGDTRTVRS